MHFPRSCGILLHPTSLPGRYGIGDLGAAARQFADFLTQSGQRYWQILPLGPTGFGDSPYQSFSAFAGNPLLIDLEELVSWGLLPQSELDNAPNFPTDHVDYDAVAEWKFPLLWQAHETYRNRVASSIDDPFNAFRQSNQEWLDDFTLFTALKKEFDGQEWTEWPEAVRKRDPQTLDKWRSQLHDGIEARALWQFIFHHQWMNLKQYCHNQGLRIIGDIPIYVAHDSADVWANRDLFQLDEEGKPTVVAGVPPDYFSETGQLWGNPLYDWEALSKTGYSWWMKRVQHTLKQVDIIRLDHFRGFEAYWEVPADHETAQDGKWVKGPGEWFFDTLAYVIGSLPLIAENLGVITDEVEALRKRYELPGMAVMQFGFGGDANNPHLPHNYEPQTVAYTGTHDNDTVAGWWNSAPDEQSTRDAASINQEKEHAAKYLPTDGQAVHWDFIRALYNTVAHTAVIPLQDALGLGSEARMNQPGDPQGNWQWRCPPSPPWNRMQAKLLDLAELYGRVNPDAPRQESTDHESGESTR